MTQYTCSTAKRPYRLRRPAHVPGPSCDIVTTFLRLRCALFHFSFALLHVCSSDFSVRMAFLSLFSSDFSLSIPLLLRSFGSLCRLSAPIVFLLPSFRFFICLCCYSAPLFRLFRSYLRPFFRSSFTLFSTSSQLSDGGVFRSIGNCYFFLVF